MLGKERRKDPWIMQIFIMFLKNHPGYKLVHTLESAMYPEPYCMFNPVDFITMEIEYIKTIRKMDVLYFHYNQGFHGIYYNGTLTKKWRYRAEKHSNLRSHKKVADDPNIGI